MLDVHPPHEAAHTWKDFFIHIATIVVGLLIAIGLEQTVEHFHQRHQLHRLEHALDDENEHNLRIIAQDIALMRSIEATEQANMTALEPSSSGHAQQPLVFLPSPLTTNDPHTRWSPPVGSVWAAAHDTGALTLMPTVRATYLSRLDLAYASVAEIQHQLFDQEYRVRSYASLHTDMNAMTPQEHEELLMAVSQYRQIAAHARYILERVAGNIEQSH